jgi:hypothetical protein
MMLRRLLWVAALLPAVAFAAGSFTLSSPEIKPGATIAEAQVYKGRAGRSPPFMINANQIGKATFTGKYGRK